ncbi:MAG: STAS-like domain-containing protein [Gammaproteobacteria bacterium]|nr:STAS-like domain-containing protein [Gammaproteobacteria bacterium]
MRKDLAISVFEVTSNPLCVASFDGQRIYDRLVVALQAGRSVTLSFRNVTTLTTTFLDTAIGQLYSVFSEEKIRSSLKVQDMLADDLTLLKRVIETAKQYFKIMRRDNSAAWEKEGTEE